MADITEFEAQQIETANAPGRTPVVFVHGLWLLPSSWDRWRRVFEDAGYTTLAPGWPDDPNTVTEANASIPRCSRTRPSVRSPTTSKRSSGSCPRSRRSSAIRSEVCSPRSWRAAAWRRHRSPSTRRRSAACSRCRSRRSSRRGRCSAIRRTTAGRSRSPTSSSGTAFANAVDEDEAKELYATFAVPAPGAPLFQAATANLNPWTEAKVEQQEHGPRPAAHHLRREGPHGSVGDRQRVLQEAEAQPRRHRDRRDPEPRPCTHHRPRMAARSRSPRSARSSSASSHRRRDKA